MQNKSGTRIQIPGQPTGEPFRIATVSGTPEACEMVKQMIDRIVLEQSSSSVMTGAAGGPGGYQQQQQYGGGYQQQQQAGGQQDYSAEWAAYYAAQQQAQQQAAVAAPAPNPVAAAPAPGPDANAYHEEFFRYAYYYGEPAARQYYGTWSPPEGTPNPYGVNPMASRLHQPIVHLLLPVRQLQPQLQQTGLQLRLQSMEEQHLERLAEERCQICPPG